MEDQAITELVDRSAPRDVRDAAAWLSANGYTLDSHRGAGTFGAQLVYRGEARVVITVDRSQWMLDVAPSPDADAWQYDLLIVAQSARPYGEVFPRVDPTSLGSTPEQLPEGVSWRATLPGVLRWVGNHDVRDAVTRGRDERARLMRIRVPRR